MEKLFGFLKNKGNEVVKAGMVSAAVFAASESYGQTSTLKNEQGAVMPLRIETRNDQNMPEGFKRDQVVALENGKEKTVASLFWFEDGKTEAQFVTKKKHPGAFVPEINYEVVNAEAKKQKDGETVLAFEAAYESATQKGEIEGVAIENGQSVGSTTYSKSGFVYMKPNGSMEFYRVKNDQTGKYDTTAADQLVARAKAEKASLFQQIPAIWDGVEKLNSTNQQKFEWRAICQTKDGKKFVLNCSEKITLRDFLIFALNLKGANGEQLVDDLMLTDTGVYSYGIFRDENQLKSSGFQSYTMVDENYANVKQGYTNVVVIGTKKK